VEAYEYGECSWSPVEHAERRAVRFPEALRGPSEGSNNFDGMAPVWNACSPGSGPNFECALRCLASPTASSKSLRESWKYLKRAGAAVRQVCSAMAAVEYRSETCSPARTLTRMRTYVADIVL